MIKLMGVAMGSPVIPIVANLYMESLEQNALSPAPHPPCSGAGLWMTPLSSTRRSTNKASFNTSAVLTLPSSLQWRTTRRMGPSPSWTPLLNLKLMVAYPSLYTDNPHIETSTYSVIVTITSQPNVVSSTPSPIGPEQCAASLSCSNKKRTTSRRLSLNANILSGLWTRWRKRLNMSTSEVSDGVNNQGTTGAQAVTSEVKTKGHIDIPYTQGLCESIKKIGGRYGIQTHFKGGSTIKNLLVSPKGKDPMVNQSGAIYW